MSRRSGLLALVLCTSAGVHGAPPYPVIDVHLHSDWWGKPGIVQGYTGEVGADSAAGHMSGTLEALERHHVVLGLVDGENAEAWVDRSSGRLVRAGAPCGPDSDPAELREALASGRIAALSEFAPQYLGIAPDDPSIAHCFAIAEAFDVPVGLHMGPGPAGAAYRGSPGYRMALSDPLLLEDVLIEHPELRLWIMHAGWPMLGETIGLLHAHPQVHVDIGVINWVLPRQEFHHYLRRIVQAGFHDRILFGSDQMVWPQAIGTGIEAVTSADFLSEDQKRDILCRNAARFLRLEADLCAPPHRSADE